MPTIEVPVLIVGAGPVGATAALALARHGVASWMIDRRDGPHRAPQAHVVNPRSLEIFRSLDVDMPRLQAAATPRADSREVAFCTSLTGAELGRLTYEAQDDHVTALTPEPLLNLAQHRLEPILIDTIGRESNVRLDWRHEWRALDQGADGVTSQVWDTVHDTALTVRSRWVLAADGAGSRVRRALGIAMDGPDSLQHFIMIHVGANLRHLVRDRPAILYWNLDPSCAGTFVAHDIDSTWVFMHRYDPEREPAATFTPDVCLALVQRAIGRTDVPLTVRDVSPWTMTAQVAERFQDGHVFLIGDSAHRFPPTGGLGLNTGVADAHNLAWKLAAVAHGQASPTLLDTYTVERRPVAQHNADQSLANAMTILQLFIELGLLEDDRDVAQRTFDALLASTDGHARIAASIEAQRNHFDMLGLHLGFAYDQGALVADGSIRPVPTHPTREYIPNGCPGSRVPHAWISVNGRERSILDLLDPTTWTLLTGPVGAVAWASATETATRAVRLVVLGRDGSDPGAAWWNACGIRPDGALLVRPDQHIAWRAPERPLDPAGALGKALTAILHG